MVCPLAPEQQPTNYTGLLSAASLLNYTEIGTTQYAAKGAVIIRAKRSVNSQLAINIQIKPGWHINAHKPLQEELIPTTISLTGDKLSHINYPPATLKKLSFGQQSLALYEKELSLTATLPESYSNKPLINIQIQLQACNNKHCLAPETISIASQKTFDN